MFSQSTTNQQLAMLFKPKFILLLHYLAVVVNSQSWVTDERELKRPYIARFKSAECKNFDNTTIVVSKCFVKAYSRSLSTFNIVNTIVKPVTKPVYLQFIMHYRYGLIYREIFNSHKRDFCEFLDNQDSNPILKLSFLNVFKSMPNFPKKCPITKTVEFMNVTIDAEFIQNGTLRYPEGFYKYVFKYFKPEERQLSEIRIVVETRSPVKESFG
jgi:hypothetical protein